MTTEQQREKRNGFLFMLGYFTFGYLAVNWLSQHRAGFFDLSLPFEHQIPFVPVFIFGYILVYFSVFLGYLVLKEWQDWQRAMTSFVLATTVAYIIFLLLPVRMSMRPELAGLTGISNTVSRFFYLIDLPYNCFPSLHVTYPTLATLAAWRHHRAMRWVLLAMTLVVATSVVLVKQHYIADVVAGFINAGLCFWVAVRCESGYGAFVTRMKGWFGVRREKTA